jgi:ubiquitin C-terminal hydrolase
MVVWSSLRHIILPRFLQPRAKTQPSTTSRKRMSPSGSSVEVIDPDPPYDRQLETRARLLLNLYGAPEGSGFTPKRPRKDAREPWFIVEHGWFNRLKSGGSWENWFKCHNPGMLNNNILMDQKNPNRLKERLIEFIDYDVVCEGIWMHIKQWYGVEGPEIIRYSSSDGQLEVYPPIFKVSVTSEADEKWNDTSAIEMTFSKGSTIEEMVAEIQKKLECGSFTLKHCSYGDYFSAVKVSESKVQDMGWKTGDRLLVVFTAPKSIPDSLIPVNASSRYSSPSGLISNGVSTSGLVSNDVKGSLPISNVGNKNGTKLKNGLCGLNNLGNTCYMNAVLQCLSHTSPLRAQLLSDKAMKSVNPESKLGRKGDVVKELGVLMRQMWSGENSAIAPYGFKQALDRWTSMFRGYQQQDAHEALAFILDALHEDTNFSLPAERPSVCESVFVGTSQSKLTCPICFTESTNAETFQVLSLEMPVPSPSPSDSYLTKSEQSRFLKFVGRTGQLNLVEVPRVQTDSVNDTIQKLKSSLGTDTELILAQVKKDFRDTQNLRVMEILSGAAKIESLPPQWEVVAFEVDGIPDSELVLVQGLHRRNNVIVSVPFVIAITGKTTKRELLEKVEERFGATGNTTYTLKTAVKAQKVTDSGHDIVVDDSSFSNRLWSSAVLLLDWNKPMEFHGYSLAALTVPEQSLAAMQPQNVVHTPQEKNHLDTIPDRIEAFCSIETLAEDNLWLCPKCNEKRAASKQISLAVLPEVLVLHLKRFTAQGAKLTSSVIFTPLLQVNEKDYELYAIIRHHGSTIQGGHYDSLVRSAIDNKWYQFDDSRVLPVQSNRMGKFELPGIVWNDPSAYIFFYRKRQFAAL